jgi:Zn finger protein HypA/HybF involved in hydrogenase expression
MKREYAIDKLIENADKCVNMLDLCHRMGIENVGGEDYKEIKQLAQELGVELKFSYKRNTMCDYHPRIETKDILVENSTYRNATKLKNRLIEEGLKEYRCERCKNTEWEGEPIPLQIHHVNGVHTDNRLENIQLLCPNCHSLTDTYAGKNANRENSTKHNKVISKKYIKKDQWLELQEKRWMANHPSKETLCSMFKEVGSFRGVGKLYGVSDKAIVKWLRHYDLPTSKEELKKYLEM